MAMGRTRGDACCDCASLCGIWCILAWVGAVEIVVWVALQPLLFFTGHPDHRPCATPEGLAAENSNRTNLKIIIPSTGTSGTTSLHSALCMMGLKSYHAEERCVWAPDSLIDDVGKDVIARSISRCQVDAIFLEPGTDIYPRFLEVSPGAKVIMTWRDWPSYHKSISSTWMTAQDVLMSLINYISTLPVQMIRWADWWDLVSGGQLTDAWRRAVPYGCPNRAEGVLFMLVPMNFRQFKFKNNLFGRGTFKIKFDEEAFIAQQDEIRRLTPPGDLLVFDVRKKGFKDLQDFTGVSAGENVDKKLPHPRKSNPITHNHILVNNFWETMLSYVVAITLASVETLILLPLMRIIRPFLCRCCCRRHRERWSVKSTEGKDQ